MKKLLLFVLSVISVFILPACSSDNDDLGDSTDENMTEKLKDAEDELPPSTIRYDFSVFGGEVTLNLITKKDMPEWIAKKLTETEHCPAPLWAVWKGSFKGATAYLLYNVYMSSFYDAYDADGNKLLFQGLNEQEEWIQSPTNKWYRIY